MVRFPFLRLIVYLPVAFSTLAATASDSRFGTLIFEDEFDRSETQEFKDEPGNEWTTSSDKTAKGHKEVDLRNGCMYIYTHAEANHATSVRHAFAFEDGTVGLRFKFEAEDDSLILNFADMELDTVWAGHLFKVTVGTETLQITDQKTGEMLLSTREERRNGTLTAAQKSQLSSKSALFPHEVATNSWHQIYVHVEGNEISCEIDEDAIGTFRSEGFAHKTKRLLRLLVPKNAFVDDVRIWRRK